jgi:hypothetical protein
MMPFQMVSNKTSLHNTKTNDPCTEIINHWVVNSVEQLANFFKPEDVFWKSQGKAQYKLH